MVSVIYIPSLKKVEANNPRLAKKLSKRIRRWKTSHLYAICYEDLIHWYKHLVISHLEEDAKHLVENTIDGLKKFRATRWHLICEWFEAFGNIDQEEFLRVKNDKLETVYNPIELSPVVYSL